MQYILDTDHEPEANYNTFITALIRCFKSNVNDEVKKPPYFVQAKKQNIQPKTDPPDQLRTSRYVIFIFK